jgi:hypothetical protein
LQPGFGFVRPYCCAAEARADSSSGDSNSANNPVEPKLTLEYWNYYALSLNKLNGDAENGEGRVLIPFKVNGIQQVFHIDPEVVTAPAATSGPRTGLGDAQIYNFTLTKHAPLKNNQWTAAGLISRRIRSGPFAASYRSDHFTSNWKRRHLMQECDLYINPQKPRVGLYVRRGAGLPDLTDPNKWVFDGTAAQGEFVKRIETNGHALRDMD